MSEELNTLPSKPSLDTGAMSVDALARRRVLLSGLGKGSVVLAAASVPMHTLAGTTTRCKTDGAKAPPAWATVSGCQSAVGSRIPTDTPVSQGYHCSHYKDKTCWPGYTPTKDNSCANSKFKDIIGASSYYGNWKCIDVITKASDSDECHWLTAYLNAQTCGMSKNYPYDKSEILNFYAYGGSKGYPAKGDCVNFFKNFMESCTS